MLVECESKDKVFKPITLTITVETEEDARALMNAQDYVKVSTLTSVLQAHRAKRITDLLWDSGECVRKEL